LALHSGNHGWTKYDDQDHKEVEAVYAIQHRSEYEEKRGSAIPKIPGICWACRGVGHMSNKCPTKKGPPEFLMVCPHCRKEGHKALQCPELLLTRPDHPRASPKYVPIPPCEETTMNWSNKNAAEQPEQSRVREVRFIQVEDARKFQEEIQDRKGNSGCHEGWNQE
jgi:hypothetical protein